jgi:hypothetical protein
MGKALMRYFFGGIEACSPQRKPRKFLGYDVAKGLFLLLLVPVPGIRAQEFSYVTNGDGITITRYMGPGGAVTIPDTINGLAVTGIGDMAFSASSLSTVSIGNNVSSIGLGAFAGCTSLSTLRIPDKVLSIGQSAFDSCLSLTNVIIGKGLTNLADLALFHCTNLMAIIVDGDNSAFWSASGILFNRSQTKLLVFPPRAAAVYYDVPQGVTEIGRNAFMGSTGLAALTIPNSVTNVGYGAFQDCPSLTGIYFRGAAPSLEPGPQAFFGATPAVVYYLPGTAGWGVMFGDRPTALWKLPFPLILTSSPSFGAQSNQFGFTVSWATNLGVVVEACTNLTSPLWEPLQTNTLTSGSFYFSDPQWTTYPARFYRVRSP